MFGVEQIVEFPKNSIGGKKKERERGGERDIIMRSHNRANTSGHIHGGNEDLLKPPLQKRLNAGPADPDVPALAGIPHALTLWFKASPFSKTLASNARSITPCREGRAEELREQKFYSPNAFFFVETFSQIFCMF